MIRKPLSLTSFGLLFGAAVDMITARTCIGKAALSIDLINANQFGKRITLNRLTVYQFLWARHSLIWALKFDGIKTVYFYREI
ncbi:hypothetical protein TSO5_26730 [Azospirillum sp. TSO5]|nr:hypothetical protein TSO5_26730 [Azospirillum sp. TSO5]